MRTILLSILLLVSSVSSAFSQQAGFTANDLHDASILRSLFDSKSVKNGVAIWEPNFAEAQDFNISYDSKCHTNIDTVMTYHAFDKDYGLVIFTTYGYQDAAHKEDCHACAPDIGFAIFSKERDGKWAFSRMKKHLMRWGQWGVFDGATLRKIGDNIYALSFEGGGTGQGYTEALVEFYELESFQEIFACPTHGDNSGAVEDSTLAYDWDRKIDIVPAKNKTGYYDIIATKSGKAHKEEDDMDSPITEFSGKERYRFEYGLNKYVLVK